MKILAFTAGDINLASSRLRSFYLFLPAKNFQIDIARQFELKRLFSYDLVHIQKWNSLKVFLLALFFRFSFKKVIFDFDDIPNGIRCWVKLFAYTLIATHVTTDTRSKKDYWRSFFPFKRFYVIPDVVDIAPDLASFPSRFLQPTESRQIVWIGFSNNLPSINSLISSVKVRNNVHLQIVTEKDQIDELRSKYTWVEFTEWKKDILFNKSIVANFMILNHDYDLNSRMKSENKMVLSIVAGIIPIVSHTPAYWDLAKKLHCECLVFKEIEQAFDIIEQVDLDWANNFISVAREYVLNHYSNEVILDAFVNSVLQ